jgi:sulfur carrier protein
MSVVIVNGEPREFADGATVADVVEALGLPARGIAVAVDGALRPRGRWGEAVGAGAAVEILTAAQGG